MRVTQTYKLWGGLMRLGLYSCVFSLFLVSLCHAQQAHASTRKDLNIPSEPLAPALQTVATTYEIQLLYKTQLTKALKTHGAVGTLTSDEALTNVLSGTGLSYKYLDSDTVTVFSSSTPSETPAAAGQTTSDHSQASSDDKGGNGKNDFHYFRVARVDQTSAGGQTLKDQNSAQEPAVASPQPAGGQNEVTQMETLLVSASRINRADMLMPTPVVPVSAEDLRLDTQANVGDALLALPQFKGSRTATTSVTNTDSGKNSPDLRGLGNIRTLTLLDGRRFVTSDNLNTVPSIMLKRVDVVTGGASAAWGSDAVSGVVNLVLDTDFEGFRGQLNGGMSSHSDGENATGAVLIGQKFADGKGHFLLGAEVVRQQGILNSSRPNVYRWTLTSVGGNQFKMTPDVGQANMATGGLITSGVLAGKTFDPDGTMRDFQFGQVSGTLMSGGEGGPNNQDYGNILAPQNHETVLSNIKYDFTDTLHGTFQFLGGHMANNQPYFDDTVTNYPISIDNAYLPAEARQALLAAGQTSFLMGRYNADMFPRNITDRRNTEETLALDGRVFNDWTWSTYYSHGQNRQVLTSPNWLLTTPWANAVDSVINPVTGAAECRVTYLNPSVPCVPIDLFGNGAPSQAAKDYVTGTAITDTLTKLDVFDLTVNGQPFKLPAGGVSTAFGVDWRRTLYSQTVGPLDNAQAFRTRHNLPYGGTITVKEAFGEVYVPLLSNLPGVKNMSLDGAARLSDYSVSGSIWSWKVGLVNEFGSGITGRLGYSTDIRAPQETELFANSSVGFNPVIDPITKDTAFVKSVTSGNPNLVPEVGKTLTAGLSWQPPGISGLAFSADYFDITINDIITSINVQDIVDRCQSGNTALCALIHRDPVTQEITQLDVRVVNLSQYKTNGLDLDASYKLVGSLLGASGAYQVRGMATWVDKLTVSDGVSTINYVTQQGLDGFQNGAPRWRGVLDAGFYGDKFSLNGRVRWLGKGKYSVTQNIIGNELPDYFYLDLGASYKLGGSGEIELFANIDNVENKLPPLGSNYSPYYDLVGRFYTAGIKANF